MHASKNDTKRMERLKKRSDFLLAAKKGRKWVSNGLVIQARQRGAEEDQALGQDQIRVGFTVTKRTDKSAVKRNRIKRRLRAAAADALAKHGKGGYDYVLIGRPQTIDRPYEQLCRDIIWCLKKMELYQ